MYLGETLSSKILAHVSSHSFFEVIEIISSMLKGLGHAISGNFVLFCQL